MPTFDCVEKPLAILFYRYGRAIAKRPLPFILLPVLFTLLASVGLLQLNTVTDPVYLFTPTDAPSKAERQSVHDLWPLQNGSYVPGRAATQSREVQIIVSARDGANILEKPYMEAVVRLDNFIQNDVAVEYGGHRYTYKELCLAWRGEGGSCPGNKHIPLLSQLFQHGMNITYPTVKLGNIHGYIGSSLGDVKVKLIDSGAVTGGEAGPSSKSSTKLEGSGNAKNEMILASANSWLIVYHLQFHPPQVSYLSGLWEKALQRAIEQYQKDEHITFTYFHSQTLTEELKRNADSLVPRFVLAFSILVLFSVVCNMSTCGVNGTGCYIDWVVSKPLLGLLGVVNAGMGIVAATGGLSLLTYPFNDIVGVMPFLVVAVGVDNMFLMIAALRRTNRAHSATRRMGEAMSDAATSMLITALTDAFSFGVGVLTTIPAVQIFCFYTCAAIILTFVYQITFFAGLLAFSIQLEEQGRHCVFWWCRTVPCDGEKSAERGSLSTRLFWLGSMADPDPRNLEKNLQESAASTFFRDWFAPVLMQGPIRFLAVVWFAIYMGFAIYGCMQLREGLEPVNLLVEDSYAIPHYRTLEDHFWRYGPTVQIVVNNAPDLRIQENRARIKAMVHAFANTKHTIGDHSVQFWLSEMERFYRTEFKSALPVASNDNFYQLAAFYFIQRPDEYWPQDVKWTRLPDGTRGITSFRFLVGLRDISSSIEQQHATATLREVAARYPEYHITTFMPLWLFTDQYALIVPSTVQNIVVAILVMVGIALVLIPQPVCALWVALAIASIDVGVIGYMTLWGVNLDAISMITIIMSIGFSVDYSAHITYGYVVSSEESPNDRIREALGSLGWPLTQGAVSTILAVVVLADVPAYMIVTFFKTVFLAITIGLLHGLVFLPVTLSLLVRGPCTTEAPEKRNFSDLNFTQLERMQREQRRKRRKLRLATDDEDLYAAADA